MVKIIHLSFSENSGGAARAMLRLHEGLKDIGVNSRIYCLQATSKSDDIIRYRPPSNLAGKVKVYLRKKIISYQTGKYKRLPGSELFSHDKTPFGYSVIKQLPEADIYHLHWVTGFMDLPIFFKKVNKPVVWTLHDMNPITGGCHYSSGCERFTGGCGKCPQLISDKTDDLSSEIYLRKKKAYKREKLSIIANSRWLRVKAEKSKIFGESEISNIGLGVDTEIFLPRNKTAIRSALNIPENKRVILYGSADNSNRRKGFREFSEAIKILVKSVPDIVVLTFGKGKFEIGGVDQINFGEISNDFFLSLVYNSADFYVISSLEEALGQTILESMACSVPVVGFNTGGIPELVKNDLTGFLADCGDPLSLSEAILKMINLNPENYKEISENCRKIILQEHTVLQQARSYSLLYSKLAGRNTDN